MILRLLLACVFFASLGQADIAGTVWNASLGKPAARVPVTLLKVEREMDPVEEVYTNENGEFRFERSLTGPNGQPAFGMLRVDHQGVNYSASLPPGRPSGNVRVEIYESSETPVVEPTGRLFVLQPGQREIVVNESYLFENETNPPITFRDPERGSLRFYLPPEAKGIVQVEARGPARMLLRASADPAGEENVYKVDFPIKPGENQISLHYLVPRRDDAPFVARSLYEGLQTRIAVPSGVELSGEELSDMGEEPSTQARIYEAPRKSELALTITGAGSIGGRGREAAEAEAEPTGAPRGISVSAAPIAKELPWIIGLTVAILGLGFYNLYTARTRVSAKTAGQPAPTVRGATPSMASRKVARRRT